jgi:putative phosphoesterase
MKALVLADTHLGPGQGPRLVDLLGERLSVADVVLHAGDITDSSVLEVLAAFAPVHAVLGNNDHGLSLPEQRVLEIDACQVAMVHDSGDAAGRATRLRRWFPDADVVVFGHSHIPWNETQIRSTDGHVQHHLNPGSATQRRRAPRCTVAWLEIHRGRVETIEHEAVGSVGSPA